ncbi:hypothetical protein, partial [Streptomyces sp. NRRL S-15]|uniref:hypothetical protein n=1 Tax=Streptomyces sp. NRRL S-15 TaxID=1463886 RepID=UPI00131AA041
MFTAPLVRYDVVVVVPRSSNGPAAADEAYTSYFAVSATPCQFRVSHHPSPVATVSPVAVSYTH